MRIRFLDTDNQEPYFWVKTTQNRESCPMCDAGVSVSKPVDTGGYRTFVNALPLIGAWLPELKQSKNRSKRVWKKLIRKQSKPMYGKPIVVSLSPNMMGSLHAGAR